MEQENRENIFETTEFVFRHPWLFISTIVVIMSIIGAQLSFVALIYESQALLSFETLSEETASLQDTVNRLTQKILTGGNVREIIQEVWPKLDSEDSAEEYESIRGWLRGRGGIKMSYDPRANFLTISLRATEPDICYKAVQATIDALTRENKRAARKKIEMGLDFLKEQLEYYKTKLNKIDQEISSIKIKLKEKAENLSAKERMLIFEITGELDFSAREQAAQQKLARYDEKIVELNLQLLSEEKRKERLEDVLKSGDFAQVLLTSQDLNRDLYIMEYSKIIANKQLAIANLTSQGYLREHPEIKKFKREIEGLKRLIEKRKKEIRGEGQAEMDEMTRRDAEKKVKAEIQEIELHVETLKDKVDLIQEVYQRDSQETAFKESVTETGEISTLATRLKELREQKEISEGYLENIRKRMEEAQLESRVEEAEAGLNIIVVESPKKPSNPVPFQKTQKIVFGFLISVFVGALLAYLADSLDTSVKSSPELRSLLKVPILGSIDHINTLNEIRIASLRKKAAIAGLIVFALASRFLVKLVSSLF